MIGINRETAVQRFRAFNSFNVRGLIYIMMHEQGGAELLLKLGCKVYRSEVRPLGCGLR